MEREDVVVGFTCRQQNQVITWAVNSTGIKDIDPNNSFTDPGSESINETTKEYLNINTTNFSPGITAVTCQTRTQRKTTYLYVCEEPGTV